MEVRPGLDLSAAWKTQRKVRRSADAVVARMRELTDRITLAPASELVTTAKANGLSNGRKNNGGQIAIGFTRSDLYRLGAPDIVGESNVLAMSSADDQPIVVGRVKDEFGATISIDFHTPHAHVTTAGSQYYRGAGVIDRAVAADIFDDHLELSYLINLIYEGFTPKRPEVTAVCGYAFFELALWQVQNDLLAMSRDLDSIKQPARISIALDGDELLPEAIAREMKAALINILENWAVWVPSRREMMSPGRLYAFDREVDIYRPGDSEIG